MKNIVKLRRLNEKDADGMMEWMYDAEIQKNFRFEAENKEKKDILDFINNAEITLIDGKSIHYAITDFEDEYLGTISLKNIDLINKNAEYAICLRKEAQGKGIGEIATKELLCRAFSKFGMEKVYLNVFSDNFRAIRLYEKCGFVYEGTFRKHLFVRGDFRTLRWYSILKEEYNIQEVEKVCSGGV